MSYTDNDGFDSVFGKAADDIEFDKVLEADEEDELIEAVASLDESSDDNDDFHETTGENDKDPDDIEDELEGQPDSGDNDHTDALDIDLSAEAAALEAAFCEGSDFMETTGENDKTPQDLEKELEGRDDDACNKHTGTFDPDKGSDLSTGSYTSAEKDLKDLDGATDRAASKGENLYTSGNLSTETEAYLGMLSEEFDSPDPGYDMEDNDGQESYEGQEDYTGQENNDGQEDFDGVAEGCGKNPKKDVSESGDDPDDDDFDDDFSDDDLDDLDGMEESAAGEGDDEEDEIIDAADEDDGEMSAAEIEALVAAGGDDDILDNL